MFLRNFICLAVFALFSFVVIDNAFCTLKGTKHQENVKKVSQKRKSPKKNNLVFGKDNTKRKQLNMTDCFGHDVKRRRLDDAPLTDLTNTICPAIEGCNLVEERRYDSSSDCSTQESVDILVVLSSSEIDTDTFTDSSAGSSIATDSSAGEDSDGRVPSIPSILSESSSSGESLDLECLTPGNVEIKLGKDVFLTFKEQLSKAKNRVIITVKKINVLKELRSPLLSEFWRLRNRDKIEYEEFPEDSLNEIPVFVFFEQIAEDNKNFLSTLKRLGVFVCQREINENVLAIDDSYFLFSSCSFLNSQELESKTVSSVIIEGEATNPFILDVWKKNPIGFCSAKFFAQQEDFTLFLSENNRLSLLNSKQEHHVLENQIFSMCHNVQVFCPFVRNGNKIITQKPSIKKFSSALGQNPNLSIQFVIDTTNANYPHFLEFIRKINFLYKGRCNLKMISDKISEHKLIADNTLYALGSYGWVDDDPKGCTIVLEGELVEKFLQ